MVNLAATLFVAIVAILVVLGLLSLIAVALKLDHLL